MESKTAYPKIRVSDAEGYIAAAEPFVAGNMRGEVSADGKTYTVYSYAVPILTWTAETPGHFSGKDPVTVDNTAYSKTTSRHQNIVLRALGQGDRRDRTVLQFNQPDLILGCIKPDGGRGFQIVDPVTFFTRMLEGDQNVTTADGEVIPLNEGTVCPCGAGVFYMNSRHLSGTPLSCFETYKPGSWADYSRILGPFPAILAYGFEEPVKLGLSQEELASVGLRVHRAEYVLHVEYEVVDMNLFMDKLFEKKYMLRREADDPEDYYLMEPAALCVCGENCFYLCAPGQHGIRLSAENPRMAEYRPWVRARLEEGEDEDEEDEEDDEDEEYDEDEPTIYYGAGSARGPGEPGNLRLARVAFEDAAMRHCGVEVNAYKCRKHVEYAVVSEELFGMALTAGVYMLRRSAKEPEDYCPLIPETVVPCGEGRFFLSEPWQHGTPAHFCEGYEGTARSVVSIVMGSGDRGTEPVDHEQKVAWLREHTGMAKKKEAV